MRQVDFSGFSTQPSAPAKTVRASSRFTPYSSAQSFSAMRQEYMEEYGDRGRIQHADIQKKVRSNAAHISGMGSSMFAPASVNDNPVHIASIFDATLAALDAQIAAKRQPVQQPIAPRAMTVQRIEVPIVQSVVAPARPAPPAAPVVQFEKEPVAETPRPEKQAKPRTKTVARKPVEKTSRPAAVVASSSSGADDL